MLFLKAINEAELTVSLPDKAPLIARCSSGKESWDCWWSSTKFHSGCETWRGLQATVSRTHCETWWRIGDDLGVLQQGWNRADLFLWRTHESSQVQGYPGRKLASFCSHNVPQLWGLVFPAGQCFMPHIQVNQGVDGGPPDQDPVMASPITRPAPHWKPLECDQEEYEWRKSHQIKLSCSIFLRQEWYKVTQHQYERLVESMTRGMKAVIENNLFSSRYTRSDNTAFFLLFWPVVNFCK